MQLAPSLLTLLLGILIGLALPPLLAVAQRGASWIRPTGTWLFMVLAMGVWLTAAAAWLWLVEQVFGPLLPFSVRRANAAFLAFGFLAGWWGGFLLLGKVRSRRGKHAP